MPAREELSGILRRTDALRPRWDDCSSARLREIVLEPLAEQTAALEQQETEIFRFASWIESELDQIAP